MGLWLTGRHNAGRERRMFKRSVVLTMMAFAAPAYAQVAGQGVSDKITATALSTVSGGCLAANSARKTLTLDNTGGSINIGYCETDPTVPGTPCTAAIGKPPTTTLAAGSLHYWP